MSGAEDLWYVKTPDGDVHRVTLDQLDEAFQAGRIDGKVMVLAAGATKWQSLSELAGLDEAAPAAAPVPAAMPSSLRPVSMDLSLDLDENAFKRKSPKRLAAFGIVGVLVACSGILVANRMHLGSETPPAAAAGTLVSTPAATTAAPPPPAPDPPPVAAAAPVPTTQQLTDDQKSKVAAADKALADKLKSKKKNRAAASSGGGSHKYKSQGFATGGAKGDPLSSTL
jgi:hypothetical protein